MCLFMYLTPYILNEILYDFFSVFADWRTRGEGGYAKSVQVRTRGRGGGPNFADFERTYFMNGPRA